MAHERFLGRDREKGGRLAEGLRGPRDSARARPHRARGACEGGQRNGVRAGRRRWAGCREPRVGLFERKEDRSSTCRTPPRAGAVVKQHGVGSANARTRLVSISLIIAFHNASTESVAPCRPLRTLPRISLPPPGPGGGRRLRKRARIPIIPIIPMCFLKFLTSF